MTTLQPFTRDPREPYDRRAEIEAFFSDFYEWNRIKLAKGEGEK